MDDFKFIIAILIFLIIGVWQAVKENAKKKEEAGGPPKPPAPKKKLPFMALFQASTEPPAAPAMPAIPEEGQRVTADTPPIEEPESPTEDESPELEELRRGIIMAEILSPKFKE